MHIELFEPITMNRSSAMNVKSIAGALGEKASSLRFIISFRSLAGRWSASDFVVLTKPVS
jgi:hypothetical protein